MILLVLLFFFFQAEDGIRDVAVTGVQTCALPICAALGRGLGLPGRTGGAGHRPAPAAREADEAGGAARLGAGGGDDQIGRGSGRGRGEISGVAGSLKKKKKK